MREHALEAGWAARDAAAGRKRKRGHPGEGEMTGEETFPQGQTLLDSGAKRTAAASLADSSLPERSTAPQGKVAAVDNHLAEGPLFRQRAKPRVLFGKGPDVQRRALAGGNSSG